MKPTEEIKKLIEVNEVNKVYPELNRFNFVWADREFAQKLTKRLMSSKTQMVFFNGKNQKQLKLLVREIEDENDFLREAQRFKPEKMGIIDLENLEQMKHTEKKPKKVQKIDSEKQTNKNDQPEITENEPVGDEKVKEDNTQTKEEPIQDE